MYESALALWNLGYLEQATSRHTRALDLASGLKLPANIADAYSYAGMFCQLLRDPQQAEQFARIALTISNEKGFPYMRILSAGALGWSLALQGQTAEGIALTRQGIDLAQETGLHLHYSQLAAMLGEILILAGRHEEAIDVLDEGIRRFEMYRDLLCAADLWTLKGDALLALHAGDDEIDGCYRQGLTLARELGAQVSTLRAATRLTQFELRRGQAGSIEVLQTIYASFTEGLDTHDLRAAADVLALVAG